MSLITEALKKARQEAARQEALKQGSSYPWMSGPATPPRSQTRSALLIGVLAGCLAAGLCTVGAVWWLSGRMAPQSAPAALAAEVAQTVEKAPAPVPVTEPAQPAPVIQEEAPVTREEAAPEPVRETPPPAPVRPSEPAPTPPAEPAPARPAPVPVETPAPERAAPTSAAPVVPAPQPAAPAPDSAAPAAAAAGLEDGKTYLREIPVPGGGSLKLNGIAYSEENPVALFSDRVVAPGESIGGFKVVGMDARQVALEGHGVKVYVTVK